jgi:hypothetical protein
MSALIPSLDFGFASLEPMLPETAARPFNSWRA